MQATRLAIPDVVLLEPKVFGDTRGFFYESFNQRAFNEATGTAHHFVQDNHSRTHTYWEVMVFNTIKNIFKICRGK